MNNFSVFKLGCITDLSIGEYWDSNTLVSEIVKRCAYYMTEGVKPGDKIVILHGNNNRFFADLFAVWNVGACAVCLDADVGSEELKGIVAELKATAIIYRGNLSEKVASVISGMKILDTEQIPNVKSEILSYGGGLDKPALILYTSGSTGLPKGVVHSMRTLLAKWYVLRNQVTLDICKRTLCFLSTSFGHGLICNSLYPLINGCHLFLLPKSDMVTLACLGSIVDEQRITFFSSVPSAWRIICKVSAPPQPGVLQQVHVGSAPLVADLWRDIQAWTGTRRVWNMYGITETGSWVAGPRWDQPEIHPMDSLIGYGWGADIVVSTCDNDDVSSGKYTCDSRLPIGEKGYVWLRTATIMQGYFNRVEATADILKGDWFFTGDKGYIDDQGRLVLSGRVRNEINKGGIKISPEELDMIIETHSDIQEACSFGVEDSTLGENIGVCIVPVAGHKLPSVSELKTWANNKLSSYKVPLFWYQVEGIPKTPRGKVNRVDVAAHCLKLSTMI